MEFNERRNARRSIVQVHFGEQLGPVLHALRLSSSTRLRCGGSSSISRFIWNSASAPTESSNFDGNAGISSTTATRLLYGSLDLALCPAGSRNFASTDAKRLPQSCRSFVTPSVGFHRYSASLASSMVTTPVSGGSARSSFPSPICGRLPTDRVPLPGRRTP